MVQWKWWNGCIFHCNYCWRDTCFHWTMSMGGRLHIILFLVGVFESGSSSWTYFFEGNLSKNHEGAPIVNIWYVGVRLLQKVLENNTKKDWGRLGALVFTSQTENHPRRGTCTSASAKCWDDLPSNPWPKNSFCCKDYSFPFVMAAQGYFWKPWYIWAYSSDLSRGHPKWIMV